MASLRPAHRLACRLVSTSGHIAHHARGFQTIPNLRAAQNFTMPAMSPTMTEGNIASWKVKEGDTFSTGDVLLEIETDKAQMDVEAQDDGILAKITQPDGAKAVKVGARIAVLADLDDDLSSIEIPAENIPTSTLPMKPIVADASSNGNVSPSPTEAPSPPSKTATIPALSTSSTQPANKPRNDFPIPPSITALLHENNIESSKIASIPTSGPQGRLTKGDVLAYLGSISRSYPSEQSTRISKLSHLDLSHIQLAPSAPATPPPSEFPIVSVVKTEAMPVAAPKEIATPISLAAVLSVQKKIHDTLGVHLPLSTFIERATEVANDDLPRSSAALTSDELFAEIVGTGSVRTSATSRGSFTPQITALPSSSTASSPIASASSPSVKSSADIYDLLSGTATARSTSTSTSPSPGSKAASILAGSGNGGAINLFRVQAEAGEEKRARVFLRRVKTVLESEPGRLVL